jgi:hypothetical protein
MTIAVGRGARESADAEFDSLGRNAVHVHASWMPIEGKAGRRKFFRLTLSDLDAIRRLDSMPATDLGSVRSDHQGRAWWHSHHTL